MKKMRDKIIVIGSLNYDIVLKVPRASRERRNPSCK